MDTNATDSLALYKMLYRINHADRSDFEMEPIDDLLELMYDLDYSAQDFLHYIKNTYGSNELYINRIKPAISKSKDSCALRFDALELANHINTELWQDENGNIEHKKIGTYLYLQFIQSCENTVIPTFIEKIFTEKISENELNDMNSDYSDDDIINDYMTLKRLLKTT